jgi:hypothetical protein
MEKHSGGIQIAGGLEATSLSHRTWPLLRKKSLCPSRSVGEEPELVFLPFSTNPESVGPLGSWPGPFIFQGDTIVTEMHARQVSGIF